MNMLMEMEKELALDDEDTYPFEEEEESATKQAAEEDDSDSSGEKAGGSSADRLDDGEVDELFAAYPAEDKWVPTRSSSFLKTKHKIYFKYIKIVHVISQNIWYSTYRTADAQPYVAAVGHNQCQYRDGGR